MNNKNQNEQAGGILTLGGIPLFPGLRALLPPVWFGPQRRELKIGNPPYVHTRTLMPLSQYNYLKTKSSTSGECEGCDNHWCFCKSTTGHYYVKNHDKIYSGAGVLLIDNDGDFILFKNADKFSDCGGEINKNDYNKGEADKVLEKTAKRELEEETIKSLQITSLGAYVDIEDLKGRYYRCYIIKFNTNVFASITSEYNNNLKNKDVLSDEYKETTEINKKKFSDTDISNRTKKIIEEYNKNPTRYLLINNLPSKSSINISAKAFNYYTLN